jgi:hypothetical protein
MKTTSKDVVTQAISGNKERASSMVKNLLDTKLASILSDAKDFVKQNLFK